MIESNRDAAISFLQLVVDGSIGEAYEKWVSAEMRHHNPDVAEGPTNLREAMEDSHRQYPNKTLDVQRTIAEENLIAVHSRIRMTPDDRGYAHVHIFRFEDHSIVEMWDLGQPIPEHSPNDDSMF